MFTVGSTKNANRHYPGKPRKALFLLPYRCVGKLDRITQVFHCVSVRLSQPSEQALVAASKAASDRTLKDIV